MPRPQISATLALIVLSACARAAEPAARSTEPTTGYQIEIEQISPLIGSAVTADSELVLHVRWALPADADPEQHLVSVLFQQANGNMRGAGKLERPMLDTRSGTREMHIPLAELLADTSIQQPLTGVAMLQQVVVNRTMELPPEARERIAAMHRERAASGQSVRSEVRVLRTVAESDRFYFNGDAPAPAPKRMHDTTEAGALEMYMTRPVNKALAVIYGEGDKWAYGYSYGYATPDSAIVRAVRECQASAARKQITGSCTLRAVNGVVIPR